MRAKVRLLAPSVSHREMRPLGNQENNLSNIRHRCKPHLYDTRKQGVDRIETKSAEGRGFLPTVGRVPAAFFYAALPATTVRTSSGRTGQVRTMNAVR